VPIAEVVRRLEARGYDQWYVIEQDAAITTGEPAEGHGPMLDVQASIDFLNSIGAAS
jgi:inosose dehydratase